MSILMPPHSASRHIIRHRHPQRWRRTVEARTAAASTTVHGLNIGPPDIQNYRR